MNLKGRRQSKNVEDITKQKPKLTSGYEGAFKDISGKPISKPGMTMKMATVSKTKTKGPDSINYDDNGIKMAKKTGMHKMEDARDRDKADISTREIDAKNMEILLDRAFSKENTDKPPAGYDKLTEATAPTQLKEIWTPRPLKK